MNRQAGQFDRLESSNDAEDSQSSYYYDEDDNLGDLNQLEIPPNNRNQYL